MSSRLTVPDASRLINRRVILKASAAFAAMAALRRSEDFTATAQPSPGEVRAGKWIESTDTGGYAPGEERVFQADFPFLAIAPHWGASGDPQAQVEFSVSPDGQQWSDPIVVGVEDHDAGPPDRDGRHFCRLCLLDQPAVAVRYRVYDGTGGPTTLPELAFTYLDATDGPTTQDLFSAAQDLPPFGPPPIISRAAWGANERYRHEDQDSRKPIAWPPSYQLVEHIIIHHTETPTNQDPMVAIRSIYYYHAVERGWGDIGYNYIVDRFGNIYEGRYGGENVIGGHAYEYAYGSAGISVIGSYQREPPSEDALSGLIAITAWAGRYLDPFGSAPFHGSSAFPSIGAHRDANPTACPGDAFYALLPDIREAVAAVIASQPDPPSNPSFLIGNAVQTAIDGANLRSGPGLDFTILSEVPYGRSFQVVDGPFENDGYEWYRVTGDAGPGWFASSVIAKASGGSSPRFPPGTTVAVNTDILNQRVAPSLYSSVMGQLFTGETGTVLGGPLRRDGRNWYWVRTRLGRGWCDGEYLTDSRPRFATNQIVYVNTDSLRLRTSPSLSAGTIAIMPYNTKLKVKRSPIQAEGFTWYKVNSGKYGTGWCAGEYLRADSSSNSGRFSVGQGVRVVDGPLNLRSSPSTSGSVRAVLADGERLTVTGSPVSADGYTWYPVSNSSYSGWVAGEFLGAV
ncbi:MAG TPA: SH3 domain-containing protein [Thermomicrobiales bacterium]